MRPSRHRQQNPDPLDGADAVVAPVVESDGARAGVLGWLRRGVGVCTASRPGRRGTEARKFRPGGQRFVGLALASPWSQHPRDFPYPGAVAEMSAPTLPCRVAIPIRTAAGSAWGPQTERTGCE